MKVSSSISRLVAIIVPCFAFVFGGWMWLQPGEGPEGSEVTERGRVVYNNSCSGCHGKKGKGDGVVGANLLIKPRNFTTGVFKFRSTETGKLPTDQDLYHTVSSGIHTSGMISFKTLPSSDRWAVIQYIKTFSPRFSDSSEYPLVPIAINSPVPYTPSSVIKGRALFADMQCGQCHGAAGQGDGMASETQTDIWDNPIHPRDLTTPSESKLATNAIDIYRTFTTGLDGTPMPSYKDALSDEDRWHLANYVLSLQRDDQFNGSQPAPPADEPPTQ